MLETAFLYAVGLVCIGLESYALYEHGVSAGWSLNLTALAIVVACSGIVIPVIRNRLRDSWFMNLLAGIVFLGSLGLVTTVIVTRIEGAAQVAEHKAGLTGSVKKSATELLRLAREAEAEAKRIYDKAVADADAECSGKAQNGTNCKDRRAERDKASAALASARAALGTAMEREARTEPAMVQAALPFWWVTALAVLGQLLGILSFAAAAKRDQIPKIDPVKLVATFMAERLVKQSSASMPVETLYANYVSWASTVGVDPEDITNFRAYMAALSSHYGVKVQGNRVKGIMFKQLAG